MNKLCEIAKIVCKKIMTVVHENKAICNLKY